MKIIWLIPFFIQAIAMIFDEAYFHVRRGLPKWERIGHPIDTLSVLLCFIFVKFFPYSSHALIWFVTFAIISCIMVTKDEFVHKHHCSAAENWVHAILFILHPILLIILGLMWFMFSDSSFYQIFLNIQMGLLSSFMVYQIVFWNFIWKEKAAVQE